MEGEQSWSCCEWCLSPSTVKDTLSSHSTNPQNLGEKIIHTCIYQSKYWKKESFGRAGAGQGHGDEVHGGVYGGNIKPPPILCLMLRMLQIQPEKDIVVEFIRNEDLKYIRVLRVLYMRLTGTVQ